MKARLTKTQRFEIEDPVSQSTDSKKHTQTRTYVTCVSLPQGDIPATTNQKTSKKA